MLGDTIAFAGGKMRIENIPRADNLDNKLTLSKVQDLDYDPTAERRAIATPYTAAADAAT